MNHPTRPGPRAARWLILLVALPLAWLSVRNAAQRLYAQSDPALAARFWPADGTSLATMALKGVIDAGGRVDPTSLTLARDALRRAPRLATPLVVAGFAASAAGDADRAQALMEAARARQPRTDTARYWLLANYLRTGQYAASLDEIQPAMALRGQPDALLDLVGALTTIPAAHDALVAKLRRQPLWRANFFQREANNPALPPHAILSLLVALPANRDPEAARAEQRAVIGALINRGDRPAAYALWLSFLAPQDRPAAGHVYDPDFTGRPGSEPFNWTLPTASDDVTVFEASLPDLPGGHGLKIDFRATAPKPIASQAVPVSPGRYTLALKARRVGEPQVNGRIVATVRCDGLVLATMPLDPLVGMTRQFQTDLTVPASCPMVTIELAGEPGDTFGDIAAEVTALDLHQHP